jgi:2-keto-4-pentenoate hydratase/2-oxohepta-3-ene-1,7-dioic acid hydratase in catechol pathway
LRFLSFRTADDSPSFGFQIQPGRVADVPATLADPVNQRHAGQLPSAMKSAADLKTWLSLGSDSLEYSRKLLSSIADNHVKAVVLQQGELSIVPPIIRPGKIIAIGLNYKDHAAEQNTKLPENPLIFAKFPTALIGPDEAIRLPKISSKVDPEAELCIVMGQTGKGFSEASARTAIAGYTVGIDVSARDLQYADKQWVRGKSLDTFAPCGPVLVTEDEIGDPHHLAIELRVNGETRQSSNTRELIFNCYSLVSYISQAITLEAGDIIYTGTPAGVGVFRNPPVFLKDGDVVEVTIERIGTLRSPVVAE